MKRRLWLMGVIVAALAAFLVVLAACAAEATPTPTPRPPTPTPTPRPPTPTPTPLPPGVTPTPRPPTPTPVPKTPEQVRYEEMMKEWKLVEAAAKKEGTILSYSELTPGSRGWHHVQAFNKAHPEIKVDSVSMTSSAVVERARFELATGKGVGDVYSAGYSGAMQGDAEGWLLKWTPPEYFNPEAMWLLDPKLEGLESAVTEGSVGYYIWLINTNLVPEGKEPKCWSDLAKPEWKNRIVGGDPTIISGEQHAVFALRRLYGDEFIKAYLKNYIISTESARAVARGDYPLGTQFLLGNWDDFKAAPVKFIVPCEGANAMYNPIFHVFTTAPHMNAAKVMQNFFLTPEGQAIHAWTGDVPLRAGTKLRWEFASLEGKILPGQPDKGKQYFADLLAMRTWARNILKDLGKL